MERFISSLMEGQVRELFAALRTRWQAARAPSPVGPILARIGLDETRHGELSWAIDAWASSRLDARARRAVAATRDEALHEICRSERSPFGVHPDLALPDADLAHAFAREVRRVAA